MIKKLRFVFFFFILWGVSFFSRPSYAFVEVKSHIYSSFALFQKSDLIVSTHNTILLDFYFFKIGPYFGYERFHDYLTDMEYGLAIRFGETHFFEIQMGLLERTFKSTTHLSGKGVLLNLILGIHLSQYLDLSLFINGKKINSGMDQRLIVDAYPFLGVRFEF